MKRKADVLVVDDHPIVRQGLAQLFSLDAAFMPIRQAGSVLQAKAELKITAPDVMVLDLSLNKDSGLEFLGWIRAEAYGFPVLVLSMYDEAIYAERVLSAGAQAYLMKQSASDDVVQTVHRILRGEIVVSSSVQSQLLSRIVQGRAQSSGLDNLTNREIHVLQLMGKGQSTADISKLLGRSTKTIESHRSAIKRKLGLRTSLELVRYAALWQADLSPPDT